MATMTATEEHCIGFFRETWKHMVDPVLLQADALARTRFRVRTTELGVEVQAIVQFCGNRLGFIVIKREESENFLEFLDLVLRSCHGAVREIKIHSLYTKDSGWKTDD